jgi:peptidoglycan/LPS O-acetylase OafA/YrhL
MVQNINWSTRGHFGCPSIPNNNVVKESKQPGAHGDSDSSEPKHFAYIDAVRGAAFLGVLTLHVAVCIGEFTGRNALCLGKYGVQLFFLASAITLCYSMSARQKIDGFPVVNFYLRRLFRIAPMFWLALFFYGLFPYVPPPDWTPALFRSHPGYYIFTLLFIHGWHPNTFESVIPGGWSIAVEMTFYIIFPALFVWINSVKKAAVWVLLSFVFMVLMVHRGLPYLVVHCYRGLDPDRVNFFVRYWFPSQFPVFLIGFLAYQLLRQGFVIREMKRRSRAITLFAGCFLILVYFSLFRNRTGFSVIELYLVVSALAGMIIAVSAGALTWLINPLICALGKISYSCYLVHFIALGLATRLLGLHFSQSLILPDAGQSMLNFVLFVKLFMLTLVLTILIATLTYFIIERPGIAAGRIVIRGVSV